ncbi:MAG TPA: hypothetical protein VFX98_08590 [Longimicrobiaceae bacterium]|nr:hypothetical protein [Longimicrobiaceae bacterium]
MASSGLTDPWVRPGLALLALLTALALVLYRNAPQSAGELRSRAWVALSPDAFTPRIARARERAQAAERARAAGDTAGAIARLAEGEQEAWSARELAAGTDTSRTRVATELWAGLALDRAELMLEAGARPWFRGDDDQLLREARAAVERVQAVPVPPPLQARARGIAERIRRELRPGPLEVVPRL